jgi:biopolymer transport protein ExbD
MGMSVGGEDNDTGMLAEINTTPLVDVMLVLLIIFLITIPVISQTVQVELPKASNLPTETKPENIVIAIDANGRTFWNELYVPDRDQLFERFTQVATVVPQPEVHIRADKEVRYEHVGRVVVMCQRASILKVGFITEPDRGGQRLQIR